MSPVDATKGACWAEADAPEERAIPHAHVIVNNTNVETGRRLHVPDPKGLNRDLQRMARERGLGYLADEHTVFERRAKGGEARTAQREFKGRAERRIEHEGRYSWVVDIDWQIGLLEQDLEAADGPQDRADIDERLGRLRDARKFAVGHGMLPARRPRPASNHEPRYDTDSWHDHYSGLHGGSSHQHSVSHDRGGWSR